MFESDFGYHFLRVTDRRGEQFSACHVFMKPTFDPSALDLLQAEIDLASMKLASDRCRLTRPCSSTARVRKPRTRKVRSSTPGTEACGLASTSSTPTCSSFARLAPGEVSAPVQLLDEDNQAYWACSSSTSVSRAPRQPQGRLRPVPATSRVNSAKRPSSADWCAHRRIARRIDAPQSLCDGHALADPKHQRPTLTLRPDAHFCHHVCFNAAATLTDAVQSCSPKFLLGASFDLEYIVVDGGSTDGTLDVLALRDRIATLISSQTKACTTP